MGCIKQPLGTLSKDETLKVSFWKMALLFLLDRTKYYEFSDRIASINKMRSDEKKIKPKCHPLPSPRPRIIQE